MGQNSKLIHREPQLLNLSLIAASIFLTACVGPTTPMGAIHTISPSSQPLLEVVASTLNGEWPMDANVENKSNIETAQVPPQIRFQPDRQVLHRQSRWVIQIDNIYKENPLEHLLFFYNGRDVSEAVLRHAHAIFSDNNLRLVFSDFSLPSDRAHRIEVIYKHPKWGDVRSRYLEPHCQVAERRKVLSTEEFSVPPNYLRIIDSYSLRYGFNPSMVTGLIAQESAFKPDAVSWAKAIGLTQVTPLAEMQILSKDREWPRYPRLNELSVARIRTLILTGKLNGKVEWRLNPTYSIIGGLSYLDYLLRYWNMEANAKVLASLPGNREVLLSQVLLASYNSGPARVKAAIRRKGSAWRSDKKLREANNYVNRVSSYCHHFAANLQGGVDAESP